MNLFLQPFLSTDDVSQIIDKLNQNNDALVANGGGIPGDTGDRGTQGYPGPPGGVGTVGGSGVRGSQWYLSRDASFLTQTVPGTSDSSLGRNINSPFFGDLAVFLRHDDVTKKFTQVFQFVQDTTNLTIGAWQPLLTDIYNGITSTFENLTLVNDYFDSSITNLSNSKALTVLSLSENANITYKDALFFHNRIDFAVPDSSSYLEDPTGSYRSDNDRTEFSGVFNNNVTVANGISNLIDKYKEGGSLGGQLTGGYRAMPVGKVNILSERDQIVLFNFKDQLAAEVFNTSSSPNDFRDATSPIDPNGDIDNEKGRLSRFFNGVFSKLSLNPSGDLKIGATRRVIIEPRTDKPVSGNVSNNAVELRGAYTLIGTEGDSTATRLFAGPNASNISALATSYEQIDSVALPRRKDQTTNYQISILPDLATDKTTIPRVFAYFEPSDVSPTTLGNLLNDGNPGKGSKDIPGARWTDIGLTNLLKRFGTPSNDGNGNTVISRRLLIAPTSNTLGASAFDYPNNASYTWDTYENLKIPQTDRNNIFTATNTYNNTSTFTGISEVLNAMNFRSGDVGNGTANFINTTSAYVNTSTYSSVASAAGSSIGNYHSLNVTKTTNYILLSQDPIYFNPIEFTLNVSFNVTDFTSLSGYSFIKLRGFSYINSNGVYLGSDPSLNPNPGNVFLEAPYILSNFTASAGTYNPVGNVFAGANPSSTIGGNLGTTYNTIPKYVVLYNPTTDIYLSFVLVSNILNPYAGTTSISYRQIGLTDYVVNKPSYTSTPTSAPTSINPTANDIATAVFGVTKTGWSLTADSPYQLSSPIVGNNTAANIFQVTGALDAYITDGNVTLKLHSCRFFTVTGPPPTYTISYSNSYFENKTVNTLSGPTITSQSLKIFYILFDVLNNNPIASHKVNNVASYLSDYRIQFNSIDNYITDTQNSHTFFLNKTKSSTLSVIDSSTSANILNLQSNSSSAYGSNELSLKGTINTSGAIGSGNSNTIQGASNNYAGFYTYDRTSVNPNSSLANSSAIWSMYATGATTENTAGSVLSRFRIYNSAVGDIIQVGMSSTSAANSDPFIMLKDKNGGLLGWKLHTYTSGSDVRLEAIDNAGTILGHFKYPSGDFFTKGSMVSNGSITSQGVSGFGPWATTLTTSGGGSAIYFTSTDSTGSTTTSQLIIQGTFGTSFGKLAIGAQANWITTIVGGNLSDERLKTNFNNFNALNKIIDVNTYSFDWNDLGKKIRLDANADSIDGQFGVKAQEIEKIFPTLVTELETGYKTVDYTKLVPVCIRAIQEQQDIILELKERISKLED